MSETSKRIARTYFDQRRLPGKKWNKHIIKYIHTYIHRYIYMYNIPTAVVVQQLAILLCIRVVTGLILGSNIQCPRIYSDLTEPLQENYGLN